ncbi:hypothetical protein [Synechococcus sp. Cu2B8-bc1011]|uniref:hypothetical protein n=1 Tax=Synechococcus sp. Cu2B8-bc1011 TaxID=3093725 RepID=UPI0039AED9F3
MTQLNQITTPITPDTAANFPTLRSSSSATLISRKVLSRSDPILLDQCHSHGHFTGFPHSQPSDCGIFLCSSSNLVDPLFAD